MEDYQLECDINQVGEEFMTPDEELAQWKRIAGIKETKEQSTTEQLSYKIGSPEWFNRPVNTDSFPQGFRGRVKKR